jgi:hypothetical protein
MPNNEMDPGASTQMFRAFVEQGDSARQPARSGGSSGKTVMAVVLVLAVVAAVAYLALS